MSYILDAIRKSDWERRRGQVPNVLDLHAGTQPAPVADDAAAGASRWLRPALVAVIGGFAIGGAAFAAFSLSSRLTWVAEAPPPASAAAPKVPATTPAPAPTSASPAPPAPVIADAQAPVVVVPAGTGWALLPMVSQATTSPPAVAAYAGAMPAYPGAEWLGETGGEPTEEQLAALLDRHGPPRGREPTASTSARPNASARPEAPARRQPAVSEGREEPAWYAQARAELASMAAAEKARGNGFANRDAGYAAHLPALETPAASPKTLARPTSAPPIDDLPADLRAQLPPIRLSVHIYADDPALRRVRVNDVAVREGESVTGELTVAAIVREGVIFRFKGSEFFLAANDGWQPAARR